MRPIMKILICFYIVLIFIIFYLFSYLFVLTQFGYSFVSNNVMMKRCVVVSGSGGTNIEDIHLPQFTFTEGAKLSPAGSENSLGTIIMILLPSPPRSTTHSCTVAQMWDSLSLSLLWESSTENGFGGCFLQVKTPAVGTLKMNHGFSSPIR